MFPVRFVVIMENMVDKTEQIKQLFDEANNIAILPSKIAGLDAFAAGVGIYHVLRSEGKNVTIVYPGSLPDNFGDTQDVNIVSNSRNRELLVSVDYSGTDASKVNYSTNNDILHFTISPVDSDFDLTRIKAEIKGFSFDLIITIGAQSPGDLGRSFKDVGGGLSSADVINIDNTERNERFGNINAVDFGAESLSFLVLNLLVTCGMRVGSEAAEALLKGISRIKGI
jgi:nanoRNase/pAp phosphatase (c-di-AMP/oligoRNAs hydrolase)